MIEFCNEVNATEPGADGGNPSYLFLLHRGDEHKQVSGKPQIPAAYLPYLLSHPVTGRITTLSSFGPSDEWDNSGHRNRLQETERSIRHYFGFHEDVPPFDLSADATLSAGRKQGLLPGMTLHQRGSMAEATVLTVEDDCSSVKIAWIDTTNPPATGMELSTRSQ